VRIAKKANKNRIYLDYASATPLDPSVQRAMHGYSEVEYGNPSALHDMGVRAKDAITVARKTVADVLGAHADEIIFTSGGTESDNLAIFGVVRAAKKHISHPHVVTTNIEHAAVLVACRALVEEGIEVTYVPVGENGIVDPKEIEKALRPETVLVSVIYANNEIGTVQPIREIAKAIRHFRKLKPKSTEHTVFQYPLFHSDAVQAPNYLPLVVDKLGIDLVSLSSAKIYGPKGVGALYVRRNTPIAPILFGGDQERALRPGTLPVPLIVGFGAALAHTQILCDKEAARLAKLQEYFFAVFLERFPEILINGDRNQRLPNNVNVSFPNYESDFLVIELSAKGIFVSGKSACKSGDAEASHVIGAIRGTVDGIASAPKTQEAIRFSMGRHTTKKDIDAVITALAQIFEKQKKWNV
jgi:cysteine desulfurase